MKPSFFSRVVVVGGGSAGWMVAAALARFFDAEKVKITVVESEAIGTIGVGEATTPAIYTFNRMLGINEDEFLSSVDATIKWGIQFEGWGSKEGAYFHPFGELGFNVGDLDFYQYWQCLDDVPDYRDIEKFSIAAMAAHAGKFSRRPESGGDPLLSSIAYAYHFDSARYAGYLRRYAEMRGVKRIEASIRHVCLDSVRGFIKSLVAEDGRQIEGDFFIDCTGFRSVLLGGSLRVAYESWSDQLLCNSAIAVQSAAAKASRQPFTRSIAHSAGWQWEIPLRSRFGNGVVYNDTLLPDDQALGLLLDRVPDCLTEPKTIRFEAGRRKVFWKRNCLAIGLSAGFLEPLESTALHLIQRQIVHMLELFPSPDFSDEVVRRYNQLMIAEFESVRDFLILHYKFCGRRDSDFWAYCDNMIIPESLEFKIGLYRKSGILYREKSDPFAELSWLAVMRGQGIEPASNHPLTAMIDHQMMVKRVHHVKKRVEDIVRLMPNHDDYLRYLDSLAKESGTGRRR